MHPPPPPPDIPPVPVVVGPGGPVTAGTADGPVTAGTAANFTCSIGMEEVEWQRNNSDSLPADTDVVEGTLMFLDLQPEDSGVYECCTVAGNICIAFQLIVEEDEMTQGPTEEEDDGVGTLVIIIVAVVGGVSLLIFLTVVVVALFYFCRRCRGRKFCELLLHCLL